MTARRRRVPPATKRQFGAREYNSHSRSTSTMRPLSVTTPSSQVAWPCPADLVSEGIAAEKRRARKGGGPWPVATCASSP